MTIRVLLADDQPLVRSGIAMLLAAEITIDVVGEVDDDAQAITQARLLQPDVVVMDVRMPVVDGVEGRREPSQLTGSQRTRTDRSRY